MLSQRLRWSETMPAWLVIWLRMDMVTKMEGV